MPKYVRSEYEKASTELGTKVLDECRNELRTMLWTVSQRSALDERNSIIALRDACQMMIAADTDLRYAKLRSEVGLGPWRLYIYNSSGYHSGGMWFNSTGKIKHPNEELPFLVAKGRAEIAMTWGLEVRVCDGMDHLVFRSEGGEVTYGSTFWNEANPDPKVKKIANRLLGKGNK